LANLIDTNTPHHAHHHIHTVYSSVKSLSCYSSIFRWVPSSYYSLPLSSRASLLSCTIPQLCKAMLMENKSWKDTKTGSKNTRFYLVVVQYCSAIDNKKLESAVRTLTDVKDRLSSKDYAFSVAKEADSNNLTGFLHNSVSPFGMLKDVPIIIDKAIAIRAFKIRMR
jgi:prolyl-tRNA editing enzyme YbaK/EbsC (Cys-tRNA(Pro) deacylase)